MNRTALRIALRNRYDMNWFGPTRRRKYSDPTYRYGPQPKRRKRRR